MNPSNSHSQSTSKRDIESVSKRLLEQNSSIAMSLLPRVLRVIKIELLFPVDPFLGANYQAVLFAQGLQVAVEWTTYQEQLYIVEGSLVTIIYPGAEAKSIDGFLQIDGLSRLDRPDQSYNVFETAPPDWFTNKNLIRIAVKFWELLDEKNRQLINAVLFDGKFFKRFCTGPSSIGHHHSYRNGNLEHTLEVVNFVVDNIHRSTTANLQLAMSYAWLHDIGKANEYQKTMVKDRPYKLTVHVWVNA